MAVRRTRVEEKERVEAKEEKENQVGQAKDLKATVTIAESSATPNGIVQKESRSMHWTTSQAMRTQVGYGA